MSRRIPPDAFERYVALGPGRSYDALARQIGVSKRAIVRRAARDQWQERIRDIDRRSQAATDERLAETFEAMKARHLKVVRAIQSKALETLKSMPLATGMDAVRALDLALKQERLLRDKPEDKEPRTFAEWVTKMFADEEHQRALEKHRRGEDPDDGDYVDDGVNPHRP